MIESEFLYMYFLISMYRGIYTKILFFIVLQYKLGMHRLWDYLVNFPFLESDFRYISVTVGSFWMWDEAIDGAIYLGSLVVLLEYLCTVVIIVTSPCKLKGSSHTKNMLSSRKNRVEVNDLVKIAVIWYWVEMT